MKPGYTYIMGSPTGTLYIGITSKLGLRIFQHKNGIFERFSKTYNCTRLLHYERYEDIANAIREKQLKGWRREKKLNLIRSTNPGFKTSPNSGFKTHHGTRVHRRRRLATSSRIEITAPMSLSARNLRLHKHRPLFATQGVPCASSPVFSSRQ